MNADVQRTAMKTRATVHRLGRDGERSFSDHEPEASAADLIV